MNDFEALATEIRNSRNDMLNLREMRLLNEKLMECMIESVNIHQKTNEISDDFIAKLKEGKTLADKLIELNSKLNNETTLRKTDEAVKNANIAIGLFNIFRKFM